MSPKLIVIIGPTASGKTELGIEIAKRVNGEIISVDSRQIYKEMNIGTAKITHSLIHHYGINLINPDENYSVAEFKIYAERKIEEIIKRKHAPILVGGTGLWIRAIVDNFDFTQTHADPILRIQLEQQSLNNLFVQYQRLDPEGADIIDRENKRRLVRALEVVIRTGHSFFQQQTKGKSKYNALQIGLLVEREELNQRINERVDAMITQGLVNEVRVLRAKYGCEIESMTGIGYRQICAFLNENCSLTEAIEETKKATRQYAKRQMTWFKRDPRIYWVKTQAEAIRRVLQEADFV